MHYRKTNRRSSVLVFLMLLIVCSGLIGLSTPAAPSHHAGGSPLRLRLRIKNSSLRPGEATSVWAEFLDRNYEQVPSDGTRVIKFVAAPRANGSFSQQEVAVHAGDWSGGTTFTPNGVGRVLLTANSEALDSDQTVLLVTHQTASFLSKWFETVAFADSDLFILTPESQEMSVGNDSRAKFQLAWLPPPAAETPVEISTSPAARINYNGKTFDGVATIQLPVTGKSEAIYVSSQTEGTVQVTATSGGRRVSAFATFTRPIAEKIVFQDEPQEMAPDENVVPITVQVTDLGSFPIKSDRDRTFTFKKGGDGYEVDFDPPSSVLAANTSAAQTYVHVKEIPANGQITIYANSPPLLAGKKIITVRRQIAGVRIIGPSQLTQGVEGADFNVELIDKNNQLVSTDKDRIINLTVSNGAVTPNSVMIPSGKNMAKIRYVSSGSADRVKINADSEGIQSGSLEIALVTAGYWLVAFALFGGLVGGVVRHIPNDYRLQRILPRWTGEYWDLGFIGRLFGSIVGGLILYLTIKFGIYRLMGSPALPDAMDLGTRLVAFFFGVVGGFAGIYVLSRLVSWLLPAARQQTVPAA